MDAAEYRRQISRLSQVNQPVMTSPGSFVRNAVANAPIGAERYTRYQARPLGTEIANGATSRRIAMSSST